MPVILYMYVQHIPLTVCCYNNWIKDLTSINYMQWNQVNSVQQTDPLIYDGFTGAFASFFQTGDPNAHKLTDGREPGVPESRRTGEEYVIQTNGFENVETTILAERCRTWRELAASVPI
jgi:hypothetical protein